MVFSKTHYNLNTDSQILQGYLYTEDGVGGLSPDSLWYRDDKPTKDLRLSDFSRLIDDSFLLTLYLDPSQPQRACSDYQAEIGLTLFQRQRVAANKTMVPIVNPGSMNRNFTCEI